MDCNLGAAAFASIKSYLKEEAENGHKLSSAEIQDLFNVNRFPSLKASSKDSDKVAVKFLAAFYYSHNLAEGEEPFIDITKDFDKKLDATAEFLNHIGNSERDIIRNGATGVAIRTVERPATMALKATPGGKAYVEETANRNWNGLKKDISEIKSVEGEDLAPLRKMKIYMGFGFAGIVGVEAYEKYQQGDYKNATIKAAQSVLMVGNGISPLTEWSGKQIAKLPGAGSLAKKLGTVVEEKCVIRSGARAWPLLGAVIEEGYAGVAIAKGIFGHEHDWNKARGDALVCQGAAAGALIPAPGVSLVVSEAASEALAQWYNHGKPECKHVNGAASLMLGNYAIDSYLILTSKPKLDGFDAYLEKHCQILRTHFKSPVPETAPSGDDIFMHSLHDLNLRNYGQPTKPVDLPVPSARSPSEAQPQFRF